MIPAAILLIILVFVVVGSLTVLWFRVRRYEQTMFENDRVVTDLTLRLEALERARGK